MLRPLLALGLLVGTFVVPGCASCTPETVASDLAVGLVAEEARTLPILTSHATKVGAGASTPPISGPVGVPPMGAGVFLDVPDSHGWLDFRLTPSAANVSDVDVQGLRVGLRVAGQQLPLRVLAIEGGSGWASPDNATWAGTAPRGASSRLWWTVDRAQLPSLDRVALAEGAPYNLTLDFTWSHRSCRYEVLAQHVTRDLGGFVQASVNAQAFASAGPPSFEARGNSAGFEAAFRVRSGMTVDLEGATAQAVHLGAGPARALALASFPRVGWSVNNASGSRVSPADQLQVFSAGAGDGAYATSGAWLPASPPSGGLTLLLVELRYAPTQATPGATRDTFAFALAQAK